MPDRPHTPDTDAPPSPRASALLAATAVLGVALCVRLAALALLPFGADEAQTLQERSWQALWGGAEAASNPPGWRLLVHALLRVTDSLELLRTVSAGAGALGCALLTWGLARPATGGARTPAPLGAGAATMAGLGLALTPWLAREQAQARAYGLALLAAVLIALSLRALAKRGGRGAHLRAAAAVVAGAWTHHALLPWAGLWWLLAAWRLRRAGDGQRGEAARAVRMRALWRDAGPAALLVAAGLAWPLRQAIGGWWLKRGMTSASMVAGAEVWDPTWRPELWLAGAALCGLPWAWWSRRSRRSRPPPGAELTLGVFATLLAAGLWWASGHTRTVRWVHLVGVAPALWLAVAALVDRLPLRLGRLALALCAGTVAWGCVTLIGTLATGTTRADERDLARWVRDAPLRHVAAWTGRERGAMRPVTAGLLQALGGYARGPSRCTGPDRVHTTPCRARALRISGTRCRALCDRGRCLWPLRGGPEPLVGEDRVGDVPCSPGILTARLDVAQALLLPRPEPRRRMDAAGLARWLDLPLAVTRDAALVRTGRWLILLPRGPGGRRARGRRRARGGAGPPGEARGVRPRQGDVHPHGRRAPHPAAPPRQPP